MYANYGITQGHVDRIAILLRYRSLRYWQGRRTRENQDAPTMHVDGPWADQIAISPDNQLELTTEDTKAPTAFYKKAAETLVEAAISVYETHKEFPGSNYTARTWLAIMGGVEVETILLEIR